MNKVAISAELKERCPDLVLGWIYAEVENTTSSEGLWEAIIKFEESLRRDVEISEVNKRPAIFATRQAYKKCGKDPNRYRPAAEALNRRILKGQDLYRVSTLVDITNLVSMKSGFSIGGFDADKVSGDLLYGIGKENEPYQGIGKGTLNIAGLPILRDELGGVGTPTSDNVRTMLSMETKRMFFNVNGFVGRTDDFLSTVDWSVQLLKEFGAAKNVNVAYID